MNKYMIATKQDKKIIRDCIKENTERMIGKKILIFGCTLYGRDIRNELKECGLELSGFIDNNKSKTGKDCLNVPVYLPENILIPFQKDLLVIICSKYQREMTKQIMEYGYDKQNLLIIDVTEANNHTSDDLQTIEKAYENVKKGYEVYTEITQKYKIKDKLFICPYPGTGDIYMACSYLPVYLKNHKIEKYMIIVGSENCKKVCEIFGIENVCIMAKYEIECMIKAWEFLGTDIMNIKILLHWGWRCKRYLFSDNHPQISFSEMFLYDTFEFEKVPRRTYPNKYSSPREIKDYFRDKGLHAGHTIIFAPYAGSFVSEIPLEFWENLATRLKKRGYSVCTNCSNDKEAAIKNTIPVIFPYSWAVDFLDYAGGLIALRSGLCDIVSSSKTKMVILYENGFNASSIEYFGLSRMGLNNRVKEIVYNKNCEESVLAEFE